jgi:hypothetical protein
LLIYNQGEKEIEGIMCSDYDLNLDDEVQGNSYDATLNLNLLYRYGR